MVSISPERPRKRKGRGHRVGGGRLFRRRRLLRGREKVGRGLEEAADNREKRGKIAGKTDAGIRATLRPSDANRQTGTSEKGNR